MTACPFRLCRAEVRMVPEREAPGASPRALVRIPQHPLLGHEEFGLCPASLLSYPLSTYDLAQLEGQASAIERILRDRQARVIPQAEAPKHGDWRDLIRPPEPYRPGREPRPAADPYWFRQGPGQGTKAGHGGQVTGPHMEQVLLPPITPVREPLKVVGPATTTTGGGTGVSNVSEVRAALAAAGEVCGQASDTLFALEGEVEGALSVLNAVRETSIDPMGAPQILQAIEKVREASAHLREAVEIMTTYRATML